MVEVVALGVLLEEAETLAAASLGGVDDLLELGEIDLVLVSNNLPHALSLQTHFYNVSGLVIEQTVGVAQPRNGAEEDDGLLRWVVVHWDTLADLVVLSGLTLSVGGISVHIVSNASTRHFVVGFKKYFIISQNSEPAIKY